MTDETKPEPTAEDLLREQARREIEVPAEPVAGAEGLPEDVPDGHIDDEQ